jgi:hypothetical protein
VPLPALRIIAAGAFLTVAVAPFRTERALLKVAGLGDCEKVTKEGPVPASPRFWNP